MIVHPPYDGLVYRACAMEYYRAAYGGKGSRLRAGRFNRAGEPAVYMATDLLTAYAEFQRSEIGNPQPCAMIAARLQIRNLIDLMGDLGSCHPDLRAWNTDWEEARDDLALGVSTATCPSWRCKDLAVAAHRAGFIYPSAFNPGGRNIVYYPEDATAGDVTLTVIDDRGAIGKAARGVV